MSSRPRAKSSGSATGNMLRDSALGLVPETIDHLVELGRAVWETGPLRPAEIEVARLRNAVRVNCVFCRNARYDIAQADGLTEPRVATVQSASPGEQLGRRDQLIVAFVDQYYDDPGAHNLTLHNALRATFSEPELAHLSLCLAYFSLFSRCAVALGGMPDELPVMQVSLPR
ncbi:MAG: carboxymuconolactone decarboxylase family protein [Gammaproteobacteria bacterium]|nr:carboxymuconolactone decarboxylase family protein [Gammaproteobacteria bacterium]